MLVLHVTNGDSAASGLARSGLPGDVLSWRDVLHDGPVPTDDDCVAFRATRGAFIADRQWAARASDVSADFEARDARLDGVSANDEVVLWFEPDLYDQLQLIQVLNRLGARADADRPVITIVPADCFLSPMRPESFRSLFEARRDVRAWEFEQAAAAWRAFTSPDPQSLVTMTETLDAQVCARTFSGSDMVRLPHLAAALRRQLEEYPDIETGLNRTERQLCEALAPGALSLEKLFATTHKAGESWAWLGDWSFAWYVQRLSDCARPLVTHTNGTRVLAPTRDGKGFWDRDVVLTPFGHEVVRGRAHAIEANGIDRWIGGVHLTTARYWCWDARVQRTVERGIT